MNTTATGTPRRTIVVGASSGIGAALVARLVARGDHVVALARRQDRLAAVAAAAAGPGRVATATHDAAATDTVPAAFAAAVQTLGGLDEIIYAAGVMPRIGPDEFDVAKDLTVFATNVLGAIAWLDLAAALFLRQGSGRIIGISSIAGERGRRGFPAYGASKACLSAFLEALRNRLSTRGVQVITVKPGYIATEMLAGVTGTFWVLSADACAAVILARSARGSPSFFVPWRWSVVALILRLIPSFIFRRLRF